MALYDKAAKAYSQAVYLVAHVGVNQADQIYQTARETKEALRTALTEALAQPVRDDEFATRGELAARLKCWHRLTREESDELVDLLRAQPVREPLPGACKTCGNEYLASRTDVHKDKRPFIYCDCCGAMADSKTWYLTHGIGADK
jgi:hypothetical protein